MGLPQQIECPAATRWELVMDAFLTEAQMRSGSAKTASNYRYVLRRFLRDYPEPSGLAAGALQVWAYRPKIHGGAPSAHLIRTRLAALAGFYRFAQRMRLIEANPVTAIPRPRVRRKAAKRVSSAQMSLFLGSLNRRSPAGARCRAFAVVALMTGLRRQEIIDLCGQSLERCEDGAWLYTTRIKGGHAERAELPAPAIRALEEMLEWEGRSLARLKPTEKVFWWHPTAAWAAVKRAARRIGMDLCVHDLRRGAAQIMRETGASIEEIQALLHHQSIETTGRYIARVEGQRNPRWPAVAARLNLLQEHESKER